MKKLLLSLVAVVSVGNVQAHSVKEDKLCTGFVEENDRRIPAGVRSGITLEEYTAVLDRIDSMFREEVAGLGANLVIERLWDNATVNAYATRSGKNWKISMFGGMARHPAITADGFALVACHEMGHHVGGAPKKMMMWASNEGQSDYYATLKCFRKYAAMDNNDAFLNSEATNIFVKKECTTEFASLNEQAICIRASEAGLALSKVLQDLRKEKVVPDYETPDKKNAFFMQHSHPRTQCRLDTYFNGARCPVAVTEPVTYSNYKDGTCDKDAAVNTGSRPRCWFKP